MTRAQRVRLAATALWVTALGGLMGIAVGIFEIRTSLAETEKAALQAAKEGAAWQARSEEHAHQCAEGIGRLDERLNRIEARINAYESWPRVTK